MVLTSPRASSASRLNSRVSPPTVTVSYGSPACALPKSNRSQTSIARRNRSNGTSGQ